MVVNLFIGTVIFGYAIWTIVRLVKRSKKGKCAACELKNSCNSKCTTESND